MPYWGSKPGDSDYAAGAIGSYVVLIKQRMFQDMSTVLEKGYPEQAIVASVRCLRLLAEEFPQNVKLHFGRKELKQAKDGFERWYAAVKPKLPAQHTEAIRAEANAEFKLFEERVLRPTSA